LYTKVVDYSDYVTVNVSSPNTKNLREIQEHDTLNTLLRELSQLRENMKTQKKIIIKIDPDSSKQHYTMILNLVQKYKIDGIIATNTTISRPQDLMDEYKDEEGGISGQPLKELSNKVLSFLSKETNGELLLIGVGGISNAEDVYTKVKLGASLVQLYTALTFNGPQIINNIKKDLSLLLQNDGYKSISEAVGIIHS
jgi:dihydroorotate dehydrogenase